MTTLAVINLTYKKPIEEIDKLLIAHRQFLDHYYAQGIFITSGAKEPRTGGIILAHTNKQDIQAIIEQDPFFEQGLADYHITYFKPTKFHPTFEKVVEDAALT